MSLRMGMIIAEKFHGGSAAPWAMLRLLGFADIYNIELATGRVRPSADKGLLDPPFPPTARPGISAGPEGRESIRAVCDRCIWATLRTRKTDAGCGRRGLASSELSL